MMRDGGQSFYLVRELFGAIPRGLERNKAVDCSPRPRRRDMSFTAASVGAPEKASSQIHGPESSDIFRLQTLVHGASQPAQSREAICSDRERSRSISFDQSVPQDQ